ncbi:MAG: RimK family alpha-L-glutamate ligase [Planctomycetota bacterium]|nr:MAG: RimK family alpha-L-glutamate ligase [Planctomycetota bacterium]
MRIGILAEPRSWYFRDLRRAARERGHHTAPVDFGSIVAAVGPDGTDVSIACGTSEDAESPDSLGSTETAASPDPSGHAAPDGSAQRLATTTGHTPRGDARPHRVGAIPQRTCDALIVRVMPPASLEQVVFRMDALAAFEAAGSIVLNPPKSIEAAVDKFLTTYRLGAAGLPVPRTIVCENEDDAWAAWQALGGRAVVKPLFGSEGRGILLVSDEEMAYRVFRTLDRLQAVLYLQEFIEHSGYDTRVLVLDGRILGSMTRHNPHDFRTNVARRGLARPCSCSDEQAELAVRSAAVVGARFAGVDLLTDRSGRHLVIEVNAVPGWKAFSRVVGLDVARRVIMALENTPARTAERDQQS